ncbi:Radial spoke head protein 9 [Borealophlyctis nickersoniae]|nr:Radial spoke head protein 9 [Borealophlyctis nickersoniae]
MSLLNLDDLPYFSLAGFTLNIEERAAITSSLQLKKDQEKLESIGLWGKILGVQRDYYIAQSVEQANVFARKYYYSIDLVNWLQLPEITPEEMQKIEGLQGRFYGDPAYEYPIARDAEEGEEEGEQGSHAINEEKRLSGAIALMTFEVQLVPRGAYYRDSLHKLRPNPAFQGVSRGELGQLTSYFHFREGFDINRRNIMERANAFDESIDVFDTIARDEPKGVWSVQVERGGSVAIVRSLLWPGYTFFHTPSPAKWGAMYYGTGQKNENIGFML